MARLLLYTVFGAAVEAIAVERMVAAPTDVSLPTPVFNFAQITAPPSLHELVKRQEAQTVLVGPDNTCGYVSGLLGMQTILLLSSPLWLRWARVSIH